MKKAVVSGVVAVVLAATDAVAVVVVESAAAVQAGTSAGKTGNSLNDKSLQAKPGGFLLLDTPHFLLVDPLEAVLE